MKNKRRRAGVLNLGVLAALLAACGGPQPPIGVPGAVRQVAPKNATAALPANLLYVLAGSNSTRHPSIEVFNALDDSKNPQPIYTIGPKQGGEYGLLAVDRANDLFAVNYFANDTKLLIFPAGETRPKVDCELDNAPRDTFIAGDTLYLTTQNSTIEEYSLPFSPGKSCPMPTEVLTDQRAKLRGEFGLLGIAVDPRNDVFAVWQTSGGVQKIDKFSSGHTKARHFATLRWGCCAYYMTSDSRGNIITDLSDGASRTIAVFPPSGHPRKLFHPIRNGTYLGVAVADKGKGLFAEKDYPTMSVSAYAYDPATGHVGRVLRTFTSNIWNGGQSIAVFSK